MGGLCGRMTVSFLLVLSLFAVQGLAGRDYYDTLQVSKTADESQIKRAYRKLALKYHPDKVSGSQEEKDAAAKRFAEITAAYEALSDPEKRRVYDRYGEDGLREHEGRGDSGRGGGAHDIFSQFFGGFGFGGGFGGGEEEEQIPKGNDLYVELEATLRDLYLGHSFKITRDKNVIKPAKGKRQCNCRNKVVTRQLGPGMIQRFATQECEECQALAYVRESETLSVSVEAGTPDGHQITFFEEGEPLIDGEPGDLIFVVKTAPHSHFSRDGKDLWYNQTITLEDALIGFSRQIEHLDGRHVPLLSQGVTIPGEVRTIQGQGMPLFENGHEFGDLHVRFTVAFPKALSEAQKAAVRKMSLKHDEL